MLPIARAIPTTLEDVEQTVYALLDSADLDQQAKTEILGQETMSFIRNFPLHVEPICQILIALYKANILTNDNRRNLFNKYNELKQRLSQQIYRDEFGQLKCDRNEFSFLQDEMSGLTFGLSETCLLLQSSNLLTSERYAKLHHNLLSLTYLAETMQSLKNYELLLPAIVDCLLDTKNAMALKDYIEAFPALNSVGMLNELNISRLLNLFEEAQRYNPYLIHMLTDHTSRSDSQEADWTLYCRVNSLPQLIILLHQHELLTPDIFNFILENAKFPLHDGASALASDGLLNKDTFELLISLPQYADNIGQGISALSQVNLLDAEGINIKKCMEKIEHLTQISNALNTLQSEDLLNQIYFDLILEHAAQADIIAKVLVCLHNAKILSANNQELVVNSWAHAAAIGAFCEKFLSSSSLTQEAFETVMANIEYLKVMQKFQSFYECSYMSLDRFHYYIERAKEFLNNRRNGKLKLSQEESGKTAEIYDYTIEDYDENYDEDDYVNPPKDKKVLAIWSAVKKGDIDEVVSLLSKGARINTIRQCLGGTGEGPDAEETPLIIAVAKGDFALARFLVEHGAYINLVEDNPIIYAASNSFEMLVYLVEHGADVNAIFHSYMNVNWRPQPLDYDAINNAASSGDVARVEYLVAHGADINREIADIDDVTLSQKRSTALVSAVLSKNVTIPMVECLLKHGADYNSRGNALCVAVKLKKLEIVRYLLEQGVDANFKDGEVFRLSLKNKDHAILTLLKNSQGEALCAAVKQKKLEIVKYLLEQGADANFRDGEVFRLALQDKDPDILTLLKPYDKKRYLQETMPRKSMANFFAEDVGEVCSQDTQTSAMIPPKNTTLEAEQTTTPAPIEPQTKQNYVKSVNDTRIDSTALTQHGLFPPENLSASSIATSSSTKQALSGEKIKLEQTTSSDEKQTTHDSTEKDATVIDIANEELKHLGI